MKGRRTSEDANTDLKDEKGLLKVQIGQVEDIANGPSPSPSPDQHFCLKFASDFGLL